MAESLDLQALSLSAKDECPLLPAHQVCSTPQHTLNNMTKLGHYTCHVCNLEIPKTYIKEHESSTTHEMNWKICLNAADRLEKHRNQEINLSCDFDGTTYFCDVCVTVLKVRNKTNHEASTSHLNALRREKLLTYFSNIYLYDIDNSTISEYRQLKASSEHKMDIKTYMKVLNCLYEIQPLNIINILNEKFLEVVASNGYRMTVSVEHFHSYAPVTSNQVVCKVCSPYEGLKLTGSDIEAHKFTMWHMKRIMLLIEDMQGMRRLNEKFVHCIHCNQVLENSPSRIRTHILCNSDHIFKLEHFVHRPVPEFFTVKSKGKNSYTVPQVCCHVCNLNVEKNNLQSHVDGKKHQRAWLEKRQSELRTLE